MSSALHLRLEYNISIRYFEMHRGEGMADINWNLIKQEYVESNGAVLLKDLAAKYNTKDSTVRSRKNREKWDDELKSVATQQCKKQCNVAKKKQHKKVEVKNQEIEELINSELTDKQRLFCIYYNKCFNATKAYQKAYECSYYVANANGSRLLTNASIKEEITRLKASKFKGAMLEPEDLLQKYIDIAFSDITNYVEFGQKEITKVNEDTGEEQNFKYNYVDFKECSEVDGTLISEVKQGKDGVSIKLQDKMKALDFLAKRIGLLDIPTQQRLDTEQRKMVLLEKKADDLDDDIEYVVIEDDI